MRLSSSITSGKLRSKVELSDKDTNPSSILNSNIDINYYHNRELGEYI